LAAVLGFSLSPSASIRRGGGYARLSFGAVASLAVWPLLVGVALPPVGARGVGGARVPAVPVGGVGAMSILISQT